MPSSPRHRADPAAIRTDLAGLAVTVGLIRVERALSRKDWSDQPREPAGQPGGGRWASGGGASGDPGLTGSLAADGLPGSEETVAEDGSRVLSLRIRSHPAQDWDEQHTVTAPDGTRTVFEMAGRTQTIRDGETGDILARSTLAGSRAEPEAFVQNARSPRGLLARIPAAIEAAASLLTVLSARNDSRGKAIFVAPASEYIPAEGPNDPVMWVGRVDQAGLDAACPRNGEVQTILDAAAASVRASGNYMGAQDFGNQTHAIAAGIVRSLADPNFLAETSYLESAELDVPYGARGSLRLDVLEQTAHKTVRVYDHKTGLAGLRPRRSMDIARMVRKNFRAATNIILIEVRPRS